MNPDRLVAPPLDTVEAFLRAALVDAVEGPWRRLRLTTSVVEHVIETQLSVVRPDGSEVAVVFAGADTRMLAELRRLHYVRDGRVWWNAVLTVEGEGDLVVDVDYDSPPAGGILDPGDPEHSGDHDPELLRMDHELFPVAVDRLPAWHPARQRDRALNPDALERLHDELIAAAPGGWRTIVLDARAAALTIDAGLVVTMDDGTTVDDVVLSAVGRDLVQVLREGVYHAKPACGTWYRARFTIEQGRGVSVDLDFTRPPFDGLDSGDPARHLADAQLLLADHKRYPRDGDELPDWHPAGWPDRERDEQLLTTLRDQIFAELQDDWSSLYFSAEFLGEKCGDISFHASQGPDRSQDDLWLSEAGVAALRQLRDAGYRSRPGRGAWYQLRLQVFAGEDPDQCWRFEYGYQTLMARWHPELVLRDHELYPRPADQLPDWHPLHQPEDDQEPKAPGPKPPPGSPFMDVECFICGASTRTLERYPSIACMDCQRRATSRSGIELQFFNTDLGGGFVAHRPDDSTDAEVTRSHVAYIDGRPVMVHDAHFGGIVTEPIDVLHDVHGWMKATPAPPSAGIVDTRDTSAPPQSEEGPRPRGRTTRRVVLAAEPPVPAVDDQPNTPVELDPADRHRVVDALSADAPAGWRRITAVVSILAGIVEAELVVHLDTGEDDTSGTLDEDVMDLLDERHREHYRAGRGTWYSATLELERGVDLQVRFDYDTAPLDQQLPTGYVLAEDEEYEPNVDDLLREDHRIFPRDDAHLPPWHPVALQARCPQLVVDAVAAVLRETPPPRWQRRTMSVSSAREYTETTITTVMADGTATSVDGPQLNPRLVAAARHAHLSGHGRPWWNATITIDASGDVTAEFDDTNPPFGGAWDAANPGGDAHPEMLRSEHQRVYPGDIAQLPEWHPAHTRPWGVSVYWLEMLRLSIVDAVGDGWRHLVAELEVAGPTVRARIHDIGGDAPDTDYGPVFEADDESVDIVREARFNVFVYAPVPGTWYSARFVLDQPDHPERILVDNFDFVTQPFTKIPRPGDDPSSDEYRYLLDEDHRRHPREVKDLPAWHPEHPENQQ